MDVGETGMSVINTLQCIFPHFNPGIGGIGKRVFGDRVKITCGDQIYEMLWRHLLVLRVLINGGSHVIKMFFEDLFITRAFLVGASCHAEQREYYD